MTNLVETLVGAIQQGVKQGKERARAKLMLQKTAEALHTLMSRTKVDAQFASMTVFSDELTASTIFSVLPQNIDRIQLKGTTYNRSGTADKASGTLPWSLDDINTHLKRTYGNAWTEIQ